MSEITLNSLGWQKILVDSDEKARLMLDIFAKHKPRQVYLDTETKTNDPDNDKGALHWTTGDAFAIAIGFRQPTKIVFAMFADYAYYLKDILENETITKTYHNAKFDMSFIEKLGIKHRGFTTDTVGNARLILKSYDSLKLKSLGKKYIAIDADEPEQILKQELRELDSVRWKILGGMIKKFDIEGVYTDTGKQKKWGIQYLKEQLTLGKKLPQYIQEIYEEWQKTYPEPTYADVSKETLVDYLSTDIILTAELDAITLPIIESRELQRTWKREMLLLPVYYKMEKTGFMIDREYLKQAEPKVRDRLEEIRQEIREMTGKDDFNPNSPKQIQEVFAERLGKMPESVDKDFLENVDDELAGAILDLRKYHKIYNTYITNMLYKTEYDGRIRTSLNQFGAFTGRISSDMQQYPREGIPEINLRQVFVPTSPEWTLVFIDYAQQELRELARQSRDPMLLSAYVPPKGYIQNRRTGEWIHPITFQKWVPTDVHTATLLRGAEYMGNLEEILGLQHKAELGDKEASKLFKAWRNKAKSLNFAKVYGAGYKKLARMLKITEEQAMAFVKGYEATYSIATAYMNRVSQIVRQQGYVTNAFDRKYYVDRTESYKATNYLVQGTGADMLKEVQIKLEHKFQVENKLSRILLPVHDELISEFHNSELDMIPEIKEIMEYQPWSDVFFEAEVSTSTTNWANKKGLVI